MATEVQDVLKVSIVLVGIGILNNPDEINAFSGEVGADPEVLVPGLVIGPPGSPSDHGIRLGLNRDRITLDLSPIRTAVERQYPSQTDLKRLSNVVTCAIRCTDLQGRSPSAFGFNIELVYDQLSGKSSLQYLGERLFAESLSGEAGWNLVGGAGRLVFDSPEGRWSIQLEPRGQAETTRVFLNLNLHKAEERMPRDAEILNSFESIWTQSHNFVNRLDEMVSP